MFGRRELDTLPKRLLSPVRAPRLALAGLLAFAILGVSGSGLSGRAASEGAAASARGSFPGEVSAVFEEAGAQAAACGGPGAAGLLLPRADWAILRRRFRGGRAWAIPERLQRARRRHLHAAVAGDVVRRRGPARLLLRAG